MMMHCWNCKNLIAHPNPAPILESGRVHAQLETTCGRCGWVYEITVIHIGQRERKDTKGADDAKSGHGLDEVRQSER